MSFLFGSQIFQRLMTCLLLSAATSANAETCRWPGLCEIINQSLTSSVSTEEYKLHGFYRITASFAGELSTDPVLSLQALSLTRDEGEGRDDSFSAIKLLNGLKSFFASRQNDEPNQNISNKTENQGLSLTGETGESSDEYILYLEYKEKYEEVKADFENAITQSARQFFADDLRSIEAEWVALGYKYEIDELLRTAELERDRDPKYLFEQILDIEETFDQSALAKSITTQLSSNAWSLIRQEFPDGSAPTIAGPTGEIPISALSFEVTVFPVAEPYLLPNNVVQYLVTYFSSTECETTDADCKTVEEWQNKISITSRVILIRNLRLWFSEDIAPAVSEQFGPHNFASEKYMESSGPFLYMTQEGNIGF